jgi:RNA-binding protein
MQLSQIQRQYLRRIAHDLKPTVHVGKQGLSSQLLASADHELDVRELIKVKFLGYGDERQQLAEELVASLDAVLIGLIGTIAIVFRQHRDPEKRTIRLPQD